MKISEEELKALVDEIEGMNRLVEKMTPLDWQNLNALLDLPNPKAVLDHCPDKNFKALAFAVMAHRQKGKS